MKFVTFHGESRGERIGALAAEGWIIDLNAAYASYLGNVEREGAFYALADARVPSDMRGLFENGDRGLDAAQTALEYATRSGPETKGIFGEPIFFRRESVSIKAPIVPKKFFHTAGNFREHHEEVHRDDRPGRGERRRQRRVALHELEALLDQEHRSGHGHERDRHGDHRRAELG